MLTRSDASVRKLLTIWLLAPEIVMPVVGALVWLMQTSSAEPGSRSSVQLAASSHQGVPAPPSHEIVHAPYGSAWATDALVTQLPVKTAMRVARMMRKLGRRSMARTMQSTAWSALESRL